MTKEQEELARKIIEQWITHPETLDQLIQSLSEEPVPWEDDDDQAKPDATTPV